MFGENIMADDKTEKPTDEYQEGSGDEPKLEKKEYEKSKDDEHIVDKRHPKDSKTKDVNLDDIAKLFGA